jgi:hypothetical protein
VIGLDRQCEYLPTLIFALLLNELLASFFDFPNKDRFAPAWTPDEMVHNQVHPLLVSLVFKSCSVLFICRIYILFRQNARAKANEKPA